MRKTKLLATFLSFTLLISIMALVACGRVQENELYGFDVQESITVDMGTSVLVDVPIVTDKNGMPLDVVYEVVTMSGGGSEVERLKSFRLNPKPMSVRSISA